MKYDKSLEEVWKWKEAIYKDVKGLSVRDQLRQISQEAKKIAKRYHLPTKKKLNGAVQHM